MKRMMTKEERNTAIRRLNARGFSQKEIANRIGVSQGTVSYTLSGKVYYPRKTSYAKKAQIAAASATPRTKKTSPKFSLSILWGLLTINHG